MDQAIWAADTCVVLDILEGDPVHGAASAACLDRLAREARLAISPITAIELAPAFDGDRSLQERFLREVGIVGDLGWTVADTAAAHAAWARWRMLRRGDGRLPRRPLADVLIGAWASRHQGLVTRNPGDFSVVFPGLTLLDPHAS